MPPRAPEMVKPARLHELLRSANVVQALHVAARLEVAERLRDGPLALDALAQATGARAHALGRVLRALASLGVFAEDEHQRFRNTPASELLDGRIPGSLRNGALLVGERFYWETWGHLTDAVREGGTPYERAHGESVHAHLAAHPESARMFYAPTRALLGTILPAIVTAYDFRRFQTIVDIGGGDGTFLAKILRAHPTGRGVLFDLPDIVASAQPILSDPDLSARCQIIGGSFFERIPEGGDLYTLVTILMDWDDDPAVEILRRCRDAMGTSGRIAALVHPASPSPDDTFLDLELFAFSPSGRLRTEPEVDRLFERAGLRRTSTTRPRIGPLVVVEAEPQ